jgi:parvulin-like peptidyl-prolyl isomerase
MIPVKRLRIFVALMIAILGFTAAVRAELVEAIVATVGSDVILRSEIMSEVGPLVQELQATATSEEQFNRDFNQVVQQTLDSSIERILLHREAEKAGMTVPEDMVESWIERYRNQFDSEEAFRTQLTASGESLSDTRRQVRRQIMATSMSQEMRKNFEKEVVVSESEIAQFYEDNKPQYKHPDRVRLRRIFLGAGTDAAERARIAARLSSLREEIDLGADFIELAQAYSEGPEAETGGLVGWVLRGDLVTALDTATFALAEGAVSAPIETQFGFTLLMAEEKVAAGVTPLDEVRPDIVPVLRRSLGGERYTKWLADLRKRSRVREFL